MLVYQRVVHLGETHCLPPHHKNHASGFSTSTVLKKPSKIWLGNPMGNPSAHPCWGPIKYHPKNTNQHKFQHLAVCQNLVPLVNIKIAGKWMFIPLKMVLIGIDPYPFINHKWRSTKSYYELLSKYHPQIDNLLLIPSQLWLMIYGWSYTTLNFDHCFLNLHHLHIKKHQHQQKFQHVSIYQP